MAFKESHYWYSGSGPYCGIFGHSFIRRLCVRWNQRTLPRILPFSGEAYGTGGLTLDRLLELLRQRHLAKFDVCYVQIGENDVLSLSNHQLMYKLVNIIHEFQRQGVRRVVFGSLFHRHDRRYNKLCKRLNKILRKLHADKLWDHSKRLISNDAIHPRDKVHLRRDREADFASSIADALRYLVNK